MSDQYRKAEIYRAWKVNRSEPVPAWITEQIGDLPDTVPEGRWMVRQPGGMLSQWDADVFPTVFIPAHPDTTSRERVFGHDSTVKELSDEIGRLQYILHFKVLGDQSRSTSLQNLAHQQGGDNGE